MNVYVVLGECGEYSGRSVFVSAVYATRAEAQAAMKAASERNRVYDIWSEAVTRHRKSIDRRGPFGWKFPLNENDRVEFDAMIQEAERRAGQKPEYEPAEHTSLYEVPLGEWQGTMLSEITHEN